MLQAPQFGLPKFGGLSVVIDSFSEPAEIIHEDLFSTDQTTRSWAALEWHSVGETVFQRIGSGLTVSGPKGLWTIQAEVDADASTISWLLFEFASRPEGHVLIEWAGPGQFFTDERSMSLGRGDGIRFKSSIYKFAVGSHPLWRDKITVIRLRCQGTPGNPLTLVRASSGFRALNPESGRILESVWKVELGRELRNGFAALPGKVQKGCLAPFEWDPSREITPVMRFLAPEGPQFWFKGLGNGDPVPFTSVYGSNLSAPTEWFLSEPFDETYRSACFEDTEQAWRWSRRGWRVVFGDRAVCRHRHHYETLDLFLQRQRVAGAATRYTLRKHPRLLWALLFQPLMVGG